MEGLSRRRCLALFFLFILVFAGLFVRLVYVQFYHPRDLGDRAERQSKLILEIPPFRGQILDRHGRELALDVQVDSLGARPREVIDSRGLARRLAPILDLDEEFLTERLARDKHFVWLKRKMTDEESRRVRALERSELEIRQEWKRIYPQGRAACHVIGFTGLDHEGLEGIEYLFDSYLRGVPGWKETRKDAKRREIVAKELDWVPPVDGYDVHLTLDTVIQRLADKHLGEACRRYKALGGTVVVMDPATGDILALANHPDYDPNDPGRSSTAQRRNRAVTDVYEPGSVFKTVTLTGVLNEKRASLTDTFYCEKGEAHIGGRILHDAHPYGHLTLKEVIAKSSNIGTAKAAAKLGARRLYEYIRRFGFGEVTGISLPGEVRGIIRPPREWSKPSLSSVAMGQEVAVTAVQMAAAYAAI